MSEPIFKTPQELIQYKMAEKERLDVKETLQKVMNTREGRKFISYFFRTFGLHADVIESNGSQRDWKEGRRSATTWLRRLIIDNDCFDLYQKMEREDIEDMKHLQAEIQKSVAPNQNRG